MIAKQPKVTVPGDNKEQVMAKHGGIVGFSYFHIVWVFGFLPNTEYAKIYGISAPERVYVLSNFGGEVLATFNGTSESELPKKFKKIIDFNFLFAREFVDSQILE